MTYSCTVNDNQEQKQQDKQAINWWQIDQESWLPVQQIANRVEFCLAAGTAFARWAAWVPRCLPDLHPLSGLAEAS